MNKHGNTYRVPGASWTLRFTDEALVVMTPHTQRRWWSKESIGQLYTRDLTTDNVVVHHATLLKPVIALWGRARFDTAQVATERNALFADGLFCVGFWHTHPEPRPSPSSEDRHLARDHALAAQGQLAGLVFAILGNDPLPTGLRVWIDDGQVLHEARPVVIGNH